MSGMTISLAIWVPIVFGVAVLAVGNDRGRRLNRCGPDGRRNPRRGGYGRHALSEGRRCRRTLEGREGIGWQGALEDGERSCDGDQHF